MAWCGMFETLKRPTRERSRFALQFALSNSISTSAKKVVVIAHPFVPHEREVKQKNKWRRRHWNCYKLIAVNYYIIGWWCENETVRERRRRRRLWSWKSIHERATCCSGRHTRDEKNHLPSRPKMTIVCMRDWINQLKLQFVFFDVEIIRLFQGSSLLLARHPFT